MVRVESRLPLLGLETHVLRGVDEWDATTFLRSERSAPLYREKLIQLQQEIEQTWSLVKLTERNAEREPLLQQTLTKLEDFKRHLTVMLALEEEELDREESKRTAVLKENLAPVVEEKTTDEKAITEDKPKAPKTEITKEEIKKDTPEEKK